MIRIIHKILNRSTYCQMVIIIILMNLCLYSVADEPDSSDTPVQKVYEWVARVSSYVGSGRQALTPSVRESAEKILEACPGETKYLDNTTLLPYHIMLNGMKGDFDEYYQMKNRALSEKVFFPDILIFEKHWFAERYSSHETRQSSNDEYGRIVPISHLGADRDNRMAPLNMKINPPLQFVPFTNGIDESLLKIAELYTASGWKRDAVNVYIESMYANYYGMPTERKSAIWLKIAVLEKEMNQVQLAKRAYLMSVFCDVNVSAAALDGFRGIEASENSQATQSAENRLTSETAFSISDLYTKQNLHPFALHLLSLTQFRDDNNVQQKRNEIRREWLIIANDYIQLKGENTHLLGIKASGVSDWSAVHILRPSDTFWVPEKK